MINKYVIIKGHPILFPAEILHADMVKTLIEVESAGFFLITNENKKLRVTCTGESTSLSIRSRPEIDGKIISDFLKLNK